MDNRKRTAEAPPHPDRGAFMDNQRGGFFYIKTLTTDGKKASAP